MMPSNLLPTTRYPLPTSFPRGRGRPRSVTSLLALLLLTSALSASTFDDANRAFSEGHYRESIQGYQSVLQGKGYSAPVLFNLGNAYLQNQQIGEAILAYKRAQWLAPRDPDIAANLRYAEKQANLFPAENTWLQSFASGLSPNTWAWLGMLSVILLCISLLASQYWRQRSTVFRPLIIVSSLLWLFSGIAMFVRHQELNQAVVLSKEASVLISPFASAKPSFSLPPGEIVSITNTYQDYRLVTDAAGHVGWINKDQIEKLY